MFIAFKENKMANSWDIGTILQTNLMTYFKAIGNALDQYLKTYEKFLLLGYFNSEDTEPISEFLEQYEAKNMRRNLASCSLISQNTWLPLAIVVFKSTNVRNFTSYSY